MTQAAISPRIKALGENIVASMPCTPASKQVRAEMAEINVWHLITVYLNWADRLVRQRIREVEYTTDFWGNPVACNYENAVRALENLIVMGNNLTPYLSEQIELGYISQSNTKRKIRWDDKDFALNAYGTHHLHLGTRIKANGFSQRTNDLLYVAFAREHALFLMVGDHKSFSDGSLAFCIDKHRADMQGVQLDYSADHYENLHSLERHGISTNTVIGKGVYIKAMLTTSGTSTMATLQAIKIRRFIDQYDPLLDDAAFCEKMFKDSDLPIPLEYNFRWQFEGGDLLLIETNSNTAFIAVKWRH